MNIGFDFDKVFINYPPIIPSFIIDRLYKEKSNGILKYRSPGKFEQKMRVLSHHPVLRPLIKKNIAFLEEIVKDSKNNHYLISSRFGFLQKRTDTLIQKNRLDKLFTKTYFNFENLQPHEFKNLKIKELKIDRFVDDDLHTLKYLAKNNKHTLFFWLNPKVNRRLSTNLFAVTNISGIIN